MSLSIHMQDQIRNRISVIMNENRGNDQIDEIFQTVVSLVIVFIFLAFGVNW